MHDFAWTASRRYLERKTRFDDAGFPPVEVRLLVQPEHAHLADRYLEATKTTLRAYGRGLGALSLRPGHGDRPGLGLVVRRAWSTRRSSPPGTNLWAPPELREPEGLTIHECGHQFWYGLVANNEFEEAWLDEGLNSYFEDKTVFEELGPSGFGHRYFGPDGGRGAAAVGQSSLPGCGSAAARSASSRSADDRARRT